MGSVIAHYYHRHRHQELPYEWRLMTNDEGQQYKICDRCGAYRDFTPAAGAS